MMDIVERLNVAREGMEAGIDDWPLASQIYEYKKAAEELTELRAFKDACEKQEPSLFAEFEVDGTFAGEASGFPEILEEPIPLYLHPDPEAASLRAKVEELVAIVANLGILYGVALARIAELEAQLAERDQQVAEACAAECEGIDAINSRGWGDFLAKRIRSGEWKKHMKGVE